MSRTPPRGTLARAARTAALALTLAAVAAAASGAAAGHPGARAPVEGTLHIAHGDDFATGRATWSARLDAGSRSHELRFRTAYPASMDGASVRVHGRRLSSGIIEVSRVERLSTPRKALALQSSLNVEQSVRTAVVLLNFRNDRSEPWTPATVRGLAFDNADSVASYYGEATGGLVRLAGDVHAWVTVPHDKTGCAASYGTWAASARTQLAAAGVDLAQYQRFVYAWPRADCGWSGLGGGSNAYLNGTMTLRTFAHEIGHTFSTNHANSMSCTDATGLRVPLSANCTRSEYGDPFDVMGGSQRALLNNWYRNAKNWLGGSLDVVTAGTYTLGPASDAFTTAPKLLRIPRPDGSSLNLEFRRPSGLFDSFSSSDPVVNGVSVRYLSPSGVSGSRTTALLDMTPSTSSFGDAPLAAGKTFVDPAGISIRTANVSPAGATVEISFGGGSAPAPAAPTSTSAPTISGAPVEGTLLAASAGEWGGSPTSYTYEWRRCDSAGASCAAIAGAASAAYTPTAADVGARLRVAVTATNSGGSGTASSSPTAVVEGVAAPTPTPTPTPPPSPTPTATTTFTGTLGKKTSTLEFAVDTGAGSSVATVTFAKGATVQVELLTVSGAVVASASGESSTVRLVAPLASAGRYTYRISASGYKGSISVTLSVEYPPL